MFQSEVRFGGDAPPTQPSPARQTALKKMIMKLHNTKNKNKNTRKINKEKSMKHQADLTLSVKLCSFPLMTCCRYA